MTTETLERAVKAPTAAAVAHRLTRLTEAVAAVLAADAAGSTFTPEQVATVTRCAVALAWMADQK